MNESAFKVELIGDFSRKYTVKDFYKAIFDLHITNVGGYAENDKSCYEAIAFHLYTDYERKICNAFSYLKDGLNARVLWELRKSAALWHYFEDGRFNWFYEEHLESWGVKEIKEYRSKILATKFEDYEDKDWQYFWPAKMSMGTEEAYNFMIDGEPIFADCDPLKPDELGDPIADNAWSVFPVKSYKPKLDYVKMRGR